MSSPTGSNSISRRKLLALGGGTIAGGVLASGGSGLLGGVADAATDHSPAGAAAAPATGPRLPIKEIEAIIRAKGTYADGVLNIEIDRDDLPNIKKDGVPIKPSFEINGNLCFQSLPDGSAMLNGDLGFRPEELNPAIDQMVHHGLQWQAFHQHLFGLEPMVYFQHFRGRGTPKALAKACAAVLAVTSTPLPQAPASNPKTRLDVKRLSRIIGTKGTVSSDGVVGFSLPPTVPIILGGVRINPYLNVYTSVDFQPLDHRTVVVPDFGVTAAQADRLARVMQGQGWEINCLYNQETDEDPQLYFSHNYKVGDAYALAAEVRRGLDVTVAKPT